MKFARKYVIKMPLIPHETNPNYNAWLAAETLDLLNGPTLPISVQKAMTKASKEIRILLDRLQRTQSSG